MRPGSRGATRAARAYWEDRRHDSSLGEFVCGKCGVPQYVRLFRREPRGCSVVPCSVWSLRWLPCGFIVRRVEDAEWLRTCV